MAGGVAALLGTYWISWFSLVGITSSNPHFYGGFTLYHLQTFVTSGWYSYASRVMALGAVILIVSGIAAVFAPRSRSWQRGFTMGLAVGSGIVLVAAFGTGLPHWFTNEPLDFRRGAGEWVCIFGAVLGLIGCVMTATSGSITERSQVEASICTPKALVG